MQEIQKQELKQITGGGVSIGAFLIGGAIVTFIIGVIDGMVRPLACRV